MVDQRRCLRIGAEQPKQPARAGLHRGDDEHDAPREQAVRMRGDREDVEVVGPIARLERSLPSVCSSGVNRAAADRRARPKPVEPANSSSTIGWSCRFRPTPRKSRTVSIPAASRSAGSPDARALQDRRRAVRAGREHDARPRCATSSPPRRTITSRRPPGAKAIRSQSARRGSSGSVARAPGRDRRTRRSPSRLRRC